MSAVTVCTVLSTEDISEETAYFLLHLNRLHLKNRIWRRFWIADGNSGHQEQVVQCQRFSMRQMSWQYDKFHQEIGFLDIYDIIAQSMETT